MLIEGMKKLSEEYYDVYIGETVYDIKRFLQNRQDSYRFIYIESSDSWLLSRSIDYVHYELADIAIKSGISIDSDKWDCLLDIDNSDITCFSFAPGIYENSPEGEIKLQQQDIQMSYCMQYKFGNIGYRGSSESIGVKEILDVFGEPLYIIDMSEQYQNGITVD